MQNFNVEEIKKFEKDYSENGFWDKVKSAVASIGKKGLYKVFVLYHTLQKPGLPAKEKAIIVGALGYFIFPLDLIPDFIPVVGYGDDIAALVWAIGHTCLYITDVEKQKARDSLKNIFGMDYYEE